MRDLLTEFDPERITGDLKLGGADLASDSGLGTAIVLSLFTNARALDDDELPPGETDRRGWWGNILSRFEGDRFGSRLWLLARRKQTTETLNEARGMAQEALAWLVEDGIALRVEVTSEWLRMGVLALRATVQLTTGAAETFDFQVPAGGA